LKHIDKYRITAVVKVETDINAGIGASLMGWAVILVIMHAFKTDVIVFMVHMTDQ
jgi:hypothetical protein